MFRFRESGFLEGVSSRKAAALRRHVGARIAHFRRARGWTQEDMADRLEVSVRYLQSVESGRENLTLDTLVNLATSVRVEVRRLFEEEAQPTER